MAELGTMARQRLPFAYLQLSPVHTQAQCRLVGTSRRCKGEVNKPGKRAQLSWIPVWDSSHGITPLSLGKSIWKWAVGLTRTRLSGVRVFSRWILGKRKKMEFRLMQRSMAQNTKRESTVIHRGLKKKTKEGKLKQKLSLWRSAISFFPVAFFFPLGKLASVSPLTKHRTCKDKDLNSWSNEALIECDCRDQVSMVPWRTPGPLTIAGQTMSHLLGKLFIDT